MCEMSACEVLFCFFIVLILFLVKDCDVILTVHFFDRLSGDCEFLVSSLGLDFGRCNEVVKESSDTDTAVCVIASLAP